MGKGTNVVNLQLMPEYGTSKAATTKPKYTNNGKKYDLQKLTDELKKLKTLIVFDSKETATIPKLSERVRI